MREDEMERKIEKILEFFKGNKSETVENAYMTLLFADGSSSSIVEDSKENRELIRDFVYERIRSKAIWMYKRDCDETGEEHMYANPTRRKAAMYEEEKKHLQTALSRILETADKHGVNWIREFVDAEKNSPFYQMNLELINNRAEGRFLEGISFNRDLKAIKMYDEFPMGGYINNSKLYYSFTEKRDAMRAELFGMIADGKVKYPINELMDFYFSSNDGKKLYFRIGGNVKNRMDENGKAYRGDDEWWDTTNIIGNEDKYPEYLRGMNAIKERIINEVGLENLTDGQIRILLDQSNNEGELIEQLKKAQNSGDKTVEGNMSDKLFEVRLKGVLAEKELAEIQQKLQETRQALSESEQKTAKEKDMFLEGAGISKLTPNERRELFVKSAILRKDHPVMQEVALTTMCRCYVEEKDKKAKLVFLKTLYQIRKGGETRQEKNEMADTFARVLDKAPDLKKDENLVALSKRDTVVSQPTRQVRRQVESAGK